MNIFSMISFLSRSPILSDPAHGPLVIYVAGTAYFNSSYFNFGVAYCTIEQLRTVGMISCRGTKDKQYHHTALQDVHMRRKHCSSSTLIIYGTDTFLVVEEYS